MDQTQAGSDEKAPIADPLFIAIVTIGIPINSPNSYGRFEQCDTSHHARTCICYDAVANAVVDNRGRHSNQLVRSLGAATVRLSELEGHKPPHTGSQHMDSLIRIPHFLIVTADISKPLGKIGLFKLLWVGSESRDEGGMDIPACIMEALCAVGVEGRGGRKTVYQQDCLWSVLCQQDTFCLCSEYRGFVLFQRGEVPILIANECDVPKDKENEKADDTDTGPHESYYIG